MDQHLCVGIAARGDPNYVGDTKLAQATAGAATFFQIASARAGSAADVAQAAIGRYSSACGATGSTCALSADPLDEAGNPLRGACYGGSITCQPGDISIRLDLPMPSKRW